LRIWLQAYSRKIAMINKQAQAAAIAGINPNSKRFKQSDVR